MLSDIIHYLSSHQTGCADALRAGDLMSVQRRRRERGIGVSATREMRQPQPYQFPFPSGRGAGGRQPQRIHGPIAPADTWTLSGRVWAMCIRLWERFGAVRFPAYVSAFEGEYLQALAERSDCRTDMARQSVIEERKGGARWK
jgi:hypothetical protein